MDLFVILDHLVVLDCFTQGKTINTSPNYFFISLEVYKIHFQLYLRQKNQ